MEKTSRYGLIIIEVELNSTSYFIANTSSLLVLSIGKIGISAVTSTELGYLSGVTSNIQDQLNGKAPSSHAQHPDIACQYIEMAGDFHGGYIDFHYGHNNIDYTSRIIEEADGALRIYCNSFYASGTSWFGNLCVDNNFGSTLPSSGNYGQIWFLKA